MNNNYVISLLVLVLAVMACNVPGGAAFDSAQALLTQAPLTLTAAALSGTPAATLIASPTATSVAPAASATSTSLPCNVAEFVTDVTVPDDTPFYSNEEFTKTWRFRNAGSCSWTSSYQLVFDSGDQMGGPGSQQLTNSTVDPGQTIDISVDLKAPGEIGVYRGNWKIREPGGSTFGLADGLFWVQIQAIHHEAGSPDWPVVKPGNQGFLVDAVQFLLQAHGYDLDVDGDFGPITKARVQAFQHAEGLQVDGIVGPETWPRLIVQIKKGDHGQAVRALQEVLRTRYHYNLDVDGVFGPDTDDAVRDFQVDKGLDVDGIVGLKTWRELVGYFPD